jgi:hypothetical protein
MHITVHKRCQVLEPASRQLYVRVSRITAPKFPQQQGVSCQNTFFIQPFFVWDKWRVTSQRWLTHKSVESWLVISFNSIQRFVLCHTELTSCIWDKGRGNKQFDASTFWCPSLVKQGTLRTWKMSFVASHTQYSLSEPIGCSCVR